MELGDAAFGRCVGPEGTALVKDISVLVTETPEAPCPFCHVQREKQPSTGLEAGPRRAPNLLTPDLDLSLQNCEQYISISKPPSV